MAAAVYFRNHDDQELEAEDEDRNGRLVPPEVLQHVLAFCGGRFEDRRTLAQVCRLWRSLGRAVRRWAGAALAFGPQVSFEAVCGLLRGFTPGVRAVVFFGPGVPKENQNQTPVVDARVEFVRFLMTDRVPMRKLTLVPGAAPPSDLVSRVLDYARVNEVLETIVIPDGHAVTIRRDSGHEVQNIKEAVVGVFTDLTNLVKFMNAVPNLKLLSVSGIRFRRNGPALEEDAAGLFARLLAFYVRNKVMTDAQLSGILTGCTKMQALEVRLNREFTYAATAGTIAAMRNLRFLAIKYSRGKTFPPFFSRARNQLGPRFWFLIKLKLRACCLTPDDIRDIVAQCPNLRWLSLRACTVTDEAIRVLLTSPVGRHLRMLTLIRCRSLTGVPWMRELPTYGLLDFQLLQLDHCGAHGDLVDQTARECPGTLFLSDGEVRNKLESIKVENGKGTVAELTGKEFEDHYENDRPSLRALGEDGIVPRVLVDCERRRRSVKPSYDPYHPVPIQVIDDDLAGFSL